MSFESPKFENPMPSPEEESENEIENQEESTNQEEGESEEIEQEDTIEQEKRIESIIEEQEQTAQVEEEASIKSLPEKEASLFGNAKEKLKKNLRNVALFGVMGISLLSVGCKEKGRDKPIQESPTASVREDGTIVIERNGRKIITTERAQRMLAEGNLRALQETSRMAKSVHKEIGKIDELGEEGYVKYKIEVINRMIETMEEWNEDGVRDKEINRYKSEKAELEKILKIGKSEEFAQQQRNGFEKFLQSAEEELQQKEKIISQVKEIRDKKEKEYKEKGYDTSVVESPDFSDFDPTLRK